MALPVRRGDQCELAVHGVAFGNGSQTPSVDQRAQGHAPCERQTGPGPSSTRTMPVMEVPCARRHRRGGILDGLELAGRIHGWSFLSEPEAVDLDGDGELDLLAQILGAHGTEMSVLVEAKVRLRGREVRSWAEPDGRWAFRDTLARRGVTAPNLS